MSKKRNRSPQKKADDTIVTAFNLAEEEFGDHKSTEFLVSIVADRLGITAEQVYDALANSAS